MQGEAEEWILADFLDLVVCEFFGCSQFKACPGGCAWSDRYIEKGRAVCTQCEDIALLLDVNWGAFDIWRFGKIRPPCFASSYEGKKQEVENRRRYE